METVEIYINGNKYETNVENSVLDVCKENDVFVPTLCEIDYIEEPYGGCRLCLVEIENGENTEITTSCDTPVQAGMKINTDTNEVLNARKMALELLLSEHTGDCVAPCSYECPASLDVQGYLAHIANGRPSKAVKLIKEKTPLAISLGRACFAPCEQECRRQLVEDPIAIRQEKMYAAETDIKNPWIPEISQETGKSVGVVGGGPAGLTAAYFLRLKGHSVTIYDKMPELGGMMRYGIPNYRLPKDLLDKEINWILDLGIDIKNNTELGEDIQIEDLRQKHDAVFLAIGAWKGISIPIEGYELPNVIDGIEFLLGRYLGREFKLGKKVLVVGCGNTAMDVARTARRMNKDVTVVYRRALDQAPAEKEEIEEAEEEGIKFTFLANPEKICGCEENGVSEVTCARMELGEPDESGRPRPVKIPGEEFSIEADSVIMAIGQKSDLELLSKQGLDLVERTIAANEKFQTCYENVFTAGDLLLGPSSIVECTGQARVAAFAIDAYLDGNLEEYTPPKDYRIPFGYVHKEEKDEDDFADWDKIPRASMPKRNPKERANNFREIELGFDEKKARKEAERCVECGCLDRFDCKLREYATLYDSDQYAYVGNKIEYELDDSHEYVLREPNKCILCGSCVRVSEDIHDETPIYFAQRGAKTIITPAFGDELGKIDSDLVGNLADSCPTGALEEKSNELKPGPFNTTDSGESRCFGCGLACPVEVYSREDIPVKFKPVNHYETYLCDIGKFETIPDLESRKSLIENNVWSQLEEVLKNGTFDIVISPNASLEEVKKLQKIANAVDGTVTSPIPDKKSTAGLEDLLNTRRIFVEDNALDYNPVLKIFVKKAKENGAVLIESLRVLGNGIAIVKPYTETKSELMIVPQPGLNGSGLIDLGISEEDISARTVLIFGGSNRLDQLKDKKIIYLTEEVDELTKFADVVLPIRSWFEKKGTVKNTFCEKVEINPVIESTLPKNLEVLNRIINLVKK